MSRYVGLMFESASKMIPTEIVLFYIFHIKDARGCGRGKVDKIMAIVESNRRESIRLSRS